MIANGIVLAFILGLAFWWSTQGLFSSLLHLISTVLAGALAFALWEPIVFGFLLERQPGLAWGVGLLAPFIVALLVVRILADKLVPGNLDFHNLVNSIGGGALGAVSGLITAGIVMLGLLQINNLDLQYKPYAVNADGQVEHTQSLWVPADRITATLFTTLSGGSLKPFSGKTLDAYHHDLAKEAGSFNSLTRKGARSTIRPSKVSVEHAFVIGTKDLPKPGQGDGSFVQVIGLDFPDANAASDKDGSFTASNAQIALVCESDDGERTTLHPYGWVYRNRNAFGPLTEAGEFIRGKSGVGDFKIELLFSLPEDTKPMYLRLKGTRLTLPDEPSMNTEEIKRWVATTAWKAGTPPKIVDAGNTTDDDSEMGHTTGGLADIKGTKVVINDRLPGGIYSKNKMVGRCTNLKFQKMDDRNAIFSATGSVMKETNRVGKTLAVDRIYHSNNTRIAQVGITSAEAGSMFGKAMQLATAVAAAPELVDGEGDAYKPIGYMFFDGDRLYLKVDPSNTIRALKQIDRSNMRDDDRLIIVYRVPVGVTIKQFRIGKQKQNVTLRVQ